MPLAIMWCWTARECLGCGGTKWRSDDNYQERNEELFHPVAVAIAAIVGLSWKTAETNSRLSYIWSGRADLNCRPPGPKPGALPLGHAPTCITRMGTVLSWGGNHPAFRVERRMGDLEWCPMVPPERVELSSLAPEASTLSTELQGLAQVRISWADRANKLTPRCHLRPEAAVTTPK